MGDSKIKVVDPLPMAEMAEPNQSQACHDEGDEGKVEQQDSISRKSPYLLGLKHVADTCTAGGGMAGDEGGMKKKKTKKSSSSDSGTTTPK